MIAYIFSLYSGWFFSKTRSDFDTAMLGFYLLNLLNDSWSDDCVGILC